jgi:hypothetical protein
MRIGTRKVKTKAEPIYFLKQTWVCMVTVMGSTMVDTSLDRYVTKATRRDRTTVTESQTDLSYTTTSYITITHPGLSHTPALGYSFPQGMQYPSLPLSESMAMQ